MRRKHTDAWFIQDSCIYPTALLHKYPTTQNLFPLYRVSNTHHIYNLHTSMYNTPQSHLHNPINLLRNKEAAESKRQQSSSQAPKPGQITVILLTRDPNIHSPETRDNVHRQNDGTEDSQFAEDVSGLFLSLVHADVDLSEVVAV